MKRLLSLWLLCALCAAVLLMPRAHAEIVPPKGLTDVRIRSVPYDANQVYRIRGFVGFHIHLEFEAGERFVGLGGGDMEALSFEVEGEQPLFKAARGERCDEPHHQNRQAPIPPRVLGARAAAGPADR